MGTEEMCDCARVQCWSSKGSRHRPPQGQSDGFVEQEAADGARDNTEEAERVGSRCLRHRSVPG